MDPLDATEDEDAMSGCLAAYCREDAAYDVLMVGDWWWSECATHTASIRENLGSDYFLAIETHDPHRAGRMAPRDVGPSTLTRR